MVLQDLGLFKKFFRAEYDSKMRFGLHRSQLDGLFRIEPNSIKT